MKKSLILIIFLSTLLTLVSCLGDLKVTFDSDGGTIVKTEKLKKGELATEPEEPTKDGFNFVEWQLNGEKYLFTEEVTKNITLKAKWRANDLITVFFDSNGGDHVDLIEIEKGKKITKPTDPLKAGYRFVEWQLDGQKFDFESIINNNITLIAQWEIDSNMVVITFDSNGGSEVAKLEIEKGSKATIPTKPTKTDHIFVEWQLNGLTFDFNEVVEENITLKAVWKKEPTLSNLNLALISLTNNYQLDVNIFVYNEFQALALIKVDGNKSYYKEGEFVEFYYQRTGTRDLTVYEKNGDHFIISKETEIKNSKYDIFRELKSTWFYYENEKFKLLDDHIDSLKAIFDFDERMTIKGAEILLDENNSLSKLTIIFEEDRDPYYLYFNISNLGKVEIKLPEVE